MNVLSIASVGVIVPDARDSHALYVGTLGLPLQRHDSDDYYFSERIEGSKHFGVWPLSQAATACFGAAEWPASRPVPQLSLEFEVADEASVSAAAAELQAAGYPLLHPVKTEPWGQTIARIQTANGVIVGISYAPWLHATRVD